MRQALCSPLQRSSRLSWRHSYITRVLKDQAFGHEHKDRRARGDVLGRQEGPDKKAKKVLVQHKEGLSYRLIGRNLGLSKNTVMEIVKRAAG